MSERPKTHGFTRNAKVQVRENPFVEKSVSRHPDVKRRAFTLAQEAPYKSDTAKEKPTYN
ncbi:hypothetical protein AGMMS50276_06250 [Synergistales bacterium]|nr:hypothetical protein AGMMS50276_06250 [Synergistales bacterium]